MKPITTRNVQYRIDEANMTVEEIWSYGEERGEYCIRTLSQTLTT